MKYSPQKIKVLEEYFAERKERRKKISRVFYNIFYCIFVPIFIGGLSGLGYLMFMFKIWMMANFSIFTLIFISGMFSGLITLLIRTIYKWEK